MKSLFKKYFFILAIMCMAVTCIATFGYADFVFNTSDISNGIGTSNNSITQTADPIRQNAVFGEAGDASASGTQYYDVYFMSQSIENVMNSGSNQIDNYYYMKVDDGYSTKAHFGAFYGDNGEELTSDVTQNTNRYFKKIENVAELSINQMNFVGEPKVNKVYDGNTSGTWQIEFLCWSITPEPIYTILTKEWWQWEYRTIQWPNSNQIIADDGGYRVTGYYPSKDSSFSPFYTNNLLSIYDDYAKEINGKQCLFAYPIYTVGKDYISSTKEDYSNCVDSVTMRTYDSNKKEEGLAKTFIYDGSMSKYLNDIANSSDYSVFRLDNIVFDMNDYGSYKYTIHVDRSLASAWAGSRYIITDGYSTNYNNPSHTETDTFYEYAYNVGQDSGRYNIYLVSKSNGQFNSSFYDSGNNKGYLKTLFEHNNISSFYEKELDYMNPNSPSGSRDYYIVYERIYEPRLIGGTTGSFSYNDNYNYVFTRVGPTGEEKNHYVLRSALLDPNKITSFVYDGITRNIKNNYFAVQLLPEDGMNYNQNIVNEPSNLDENNIPSGWPTLIVSDQNGKNQVIPYLTDSLIGKDTEEAKLVRTNDSSNSGLYSLYIKVNYATNSEGRNVPTSIEIYAYQFNDMYINVYDGGENTIVYYKEDVDLTNIDETGYLTSAACTLRMINLKQGSTLTPDTPLTYYQEVDGQWKVVKEGDANKTKSLSTYLSEIESVGDCLKELVSGKYITSQNYTSFVIDKNYAFVRCENPNASNQGGVTA